MKIYDSIPLGTNDRVERLIRESPMFFVSSAPSRGKFINLSPKGLDATLRIISPTRVMYLDSHGSGCETLSHIRENGRVCVMWCAFKGDPLIVRGHGYGKAVLQGSQEFDDIIEENFKNVAPLVPGQCRSVIIVDFFQVMDSCGYAVPYMTYEGQRDTMPKLLDKVLIGLDMDEATTVKWTARGYSLDGLPGAGVVRGKQGTFWRSASPVQVVGDWVASNYQGVVVGVSLVAAWGYFNKKN